MIRKYRYEMIIGVVFVTLMCLLVNGLPRKACKKCVPVLFYGTENNSDSLWLEEKMEQIFPVLTYIKEERLVLHREDVFVLKKIKPVELLTMLEFENVEQVKENNPKQEESEKNLEEESVDFIDEVEIQNEEVVNIEAEAVETIASSFTPHSLQTIVNVGDLADYDTLVKSFYVIDSVAMVGSDLLDAQNLDNKDLRITKNGEGPQILLYHTHSQEAFADSVPGDESTTIVGVGAHLAEILRNQYGYDVLHHKGQYDVKSRDNAYSRALPEVQKILEEHPSIKVVIDLHRDGVEDESNKLVMDLDGRPTARFMFFNGVSCGKKTGNIDYLYNPNLEENLAFSFQLKKAAEEYYPGLTRKNYINAYRYNMHLCGRTTLLELGAQNNTLEEAMNACDPIAHILDLVLSGA